MDNDSQTGRIVAELYYRDPDAALDWLSRAFGFETHMVVRDAEDRLVFAESGWKDCRVAVLPEQPGLTQSPLAVNGLNTQTVRIRSSNDVIAHCEHARACGAQIIREPEQFFFGDLTYFVTDLEGHLWSFAQSISGAAGTPPEGWSVSFPSRH